MADVFEQNLPSKANLSVATNGDYLRVVGSDNNSYKQLVNDVAKKIIENYTNSSLAGSNQSVKAALDSLNSKYITTGGEGNIPAGTNLNNYTGKGVYIVPSDAIASQITNIPQPASGKLINIWSGNSDAYLQQIYLTTSSLTRMYVRTKSVNSWTAWQRLWAMQAERNTGTVTTSAVGTAAFNNTYNTNEWACISVFTTADVIGCILTPYKYGDAANGRWGFRAIGSNGSALANTSISYTAIFIRYTDML